MRDLSLRIKKMGESRLVLYLPKNILKEIEFNIGDVVILNIIYKNRNEFSVSKFNYLLSLKKDIINSLNLKEGDIIKLSISKIKALNIPKKIFNCNKVDLLFFIPKNSRKDSKIFVDEINKGSEVYLRLASFHKRGSSSKIEIRRFLNSNLFGKLLGQIQSEGSKTNFDALEFCNKSLIELNDFINLMNYMGILKNKIKVKIDYHSDIYNITKEIKNFEEFTNYQVSYKVSSNKSKGGFAFKIIIRSTLLSETILNSLKIFRELLENVNWDKKLQKFANGYFAKLLNGDGNFEITSKHRKNPQARLKISDGNLLYLIHYKKIMEKFGFKPHINKKYGYVRSLCNHNLAKKLLEIGAFENNPNHHKLLCFLKDYKEPSRKNKT